MHFIYACQCKKLHLSTLCAEAFSMHAYSPQTPHPRELHVRYSWNDAYGKREH